MAVAAIPDFLPAIRSTVAADAGLTILLTGTDCAATFAGVTRVYSEALPSPPIMSVSHPNMIAPALLLLPGGGMSDDYMRSFLSGRIEVRAYHTSRAAARALWYAAANMLTARSFRVGNVWFEAGAVSLPHSGVEPDSDFLFATGMVPVSVIGS